MQPPDLDAIKQAQAAIKIVPSWEPPVVLPPHWTISDVYGDGACYTSRRLSLRAILSCGQELDGRAWLRLSVSHLTRIPTWLEMRECKELFLGDREAYSILPPKDRYVNIHPRVLHLFALLEEGATVLPDFTHGIGSL